MKNGFQVAVIERLWHGTSPAELQKISFHPEVKLAWNLTEAVLSLAACGFEGSVGLLRRVRLGSIAMPLEVGI